MPKSIRVQEIAFEWDPGGGAEVYVFSAVTRMWIEAEADREAWELSDFTRQWQTNYVRLNFACWLDDQRQISGDSVSFHEIVNAIEDPSKTVYFYPRYKDGDGTTHSGSSDKFKVGPGWERIRIFDAERVGISPAAKRIDMFQTDTLTGVPSWASR